MFWLLAPLLATESCSCWIFIRCLASSSSKNLRFSFICSRLIVVPSLPLLESSMFSCRARLSSPSDIVVTKLFSSFSSASLALLALMMESLSARICFISELLPLHEKSVGMAERAHKAIAQPENFRLWYVMMYFLILYFMLMCSPWPCPWPKVFVSNFP